MKQLNKRKKRVGLEEFPQNKTANANPVQSTDDGNVQFPRNDTTMFINTLKYS